MTRKDLAALLGISGSMVTRLANRGMPTDSQERAQRWRKRHLETARIKGNRFDPNKAPPARPAPHHAVVQQGEAVVRAIATLNIAAVAYEAGQSLDPLVPTLRAALHAVPKHERVNVGLLPAEVMNILVADVFAACVGPDAEQTVSEAAPMSDAEAESMGEFWYQVAAGEWRVT